MSHRILSPALAEIAEAADFYESRAEGLGGEFLDEFENAIALIEEFPEAWGALSDDFRHCLLRRFPYAVIYTLEARGEILIVSVFHQSRAPGSWRDNTRASRRGK